MLQCYLLRGPVILWRILLLVLGEKMFFQLHLFFSLHTPVPFSFQCVLRVVDVVTGLFYFVIVVVCLFSVQAGLQILTYLCGFICYMDLFSKMLYLKLSVFLLMLVLVFVTCVLALCRDGSKQMSNLPFFCLFCCFFFFHWRINSDIRSWLSKIQFRMHESSAEAELWI